MVKVTVTTREGLQQEVVAIPGEPLMYALRDHDVDVEAVCGGSCSCATCHIYVGEPWLEKILAPGSDEQDVLAELVQTDARSRLSCQIVMDETLDGLEIIVAPPEG